MTSLLGPPPENAPGERLRELQWQKLHQLLPAPLAVSGGWTELRPSDGGRNGIGQSQDRKPTPWQRSDIKSEHTFVF